jgi:hypothetical protein
MKILDIPQSGKRGLNVSQGGRYGQISRTLVIPSNPRTPAQQSQRGIFATVTAGWRALTEAQRAAWTAAAKRYLSPRRCGTQGPLTGSQLYTKLNCVLLTFGQDQIDAPVARPSFTTLAPQSLVIANTAGVITLKLTCPTAPGTNTVIRASAPLSQGVEVPGPQYILGTCPVPAAGSADITSLYVAKFGLPAPADKVFVSANMFQDGWESFPSVFSAVVPAA